MVCYIFSRRAAVDAEHLWSSQWVFIVPQILFCPRDMVIQDQLAAHVSLEQQPPCLTESALSANTYRVNGEKIH